MEKKDFIIVGLGNPGVQYLATRHNVGFMVVDELARKWNTSITQEKWQAYYVSLSIGAEKVHLIKPLTFMNRSGRAVGQFYRFYKITSDQLLVIHDDLDMAPGRIKLVRGGGAGGHNGIRSLVETLGTPDFYRLKIGIGRPGNGEIHPDFPVDKYVLNNFADEELTILQSRYDSFVDGVYLLLQGHPANAMNLLNSLK
jgi:PTH1 family peptidyl-tRNA hydrolase